MSSEIKQSELRNENAAVMRRVAAGESFIVTINGRPVADVVPHRRESSRRRFLPVADLIEAFSDPAPPNPATWRADLAAANDSFGPDDMRDPCDRDGT